MDSLDLLRKGKWSAEEENYANKIILYFNQGKLRIAPGTTLRAYLSEKLRCDPMRITKKYAGSASIGKQLFTPCEPSHVTEHALSLIEAELLDLERKFLQKIFSKKSGGRGAAQAAVALRTPTTTTTHVPSSSHSSSGGSTHSDASDAALYTHIHGERERARDTDSLAHKVLSIPFQSHALQKLSLQKRVFSAPNLTTLSGSNTPKDLNTLSDEGNGESESGKAVAEDEERRFAGLPAIGEEFDLDAFNASHATARRRGWKRSRSSMALMDFERLVADDKAAGTLFFEFISNLKSTSSSSSLARSHTSQDAAPADTDTVKVRSTLSRAPNNTEEPAMKRVVSFSVHVAEEEQRRSRRDDALSLLHGEDEKEGEAAMDVVQQHDHHAVHTEMDAQHEDDDEEGNFF